MEHGKFFLAMNARQKGEKTDEQSSDEDRELKSVREVEVYVSQITS